LGRPLVVADDLGSWPHKTDAVLAAVEQHLVSAASMIATFPDFERACSEVHGRGIESAVGAHLILTEGRPATDAMRRSRRFCDEDGRFSDALRTRHLLRLDGHDRRLVAEELRAQLGMLRTQDLGIAHIDSHHHVHNQWPIAAIVIALAHDFGIGRIRLSRNFGAMKLPLKLYNGIVNLRLRRADLAGTRYFGPIAEYPRLRAGRRPDEFELHVHPIITPEGFIADELKPDVPLETYLAGIV
jgi:chitin disaccharide deacetylase